MQQSRYFFGYFNLHFIIFFVVVIFIIIPSLLRESFVDAQVAQARCKITSSFDQHITKDLKTLYEKFNIFVKP